ncbi:MAG: LysE family translocator [Rhodobacteraceae bacterium]|nr:LysE family translocator [Paracoccaceae bacterium]
MGGDVWLTYVATVLVPMSTPGPSQLPMLSNSAANGLGRGLFTAAGDLTANFLQMLAAGLDLAAAITASASALAVVKWLGVAYLVYLGLRTFLRAGTKAEMPEAERTSRKALWFQGFLTSAANPKAMVFFAALFPQFISPDLAFWLQFLALSATYLIVDGLFLTAYGGGASWLAARATGPARVWLDRVGGTFTIGAVVLLGLKSLRPAG